MINRFVDRHNRWIFPLPAILFLLVMMVFPIGYTIANSFTGWSLSEGVPRTYTGFKNYINLFTNDPRFINSIVQTFYFTAIALFFEVVLGVAMAIFIDAREYRGKRLVNSILLLPMMATPVAVAMVWLLMFEPTAGIINFSLRTLAPGHPVMAGRLLYGDSITGIGRYLGMDPAHHADRVGRA